MTGARFDEVIHAPTRLAIVSAGYSAAIGFIHTGKMLSFVYDVAELLRYLGRDPNWHPPAIGAR